MKNKVILITTWSNGVEERKFFLNVRAAKRELDKLTKVNSKDFGYVVKAVISQDFGVGREGFIDNYGKHQLV